MTTRDDKRGVEAENSATDESTDSERIARRKLLKMAYVAPAIIGTLLISEDAMAQQASCQPYVNPCNPPPECKPRPPSTTTLRRRKR